MLAQYRALPQSNLHRALRRARRAWWNSAARRTLTVAVTAASFAVVGVWLWSWLAGDAGPVFASPSVACMAGQAALTAIPGAFLVVAAWHGIRAPSLLELARRADHRQRHMQALSTAWEVMKAGGAHTVVARMLVSDAETRAESLDTSSGDNRLGVLRPAAVTGLALAAVAVFVPVPGRP